MKVSPRFPLWCLFRYLVSNRYHWLKKWYLNGIYVIIRYLFLIRYDEDVQLVRALVLCPVDPSVVALAVLQAGEDHVLGQVDGGHGRWRQEGPMVGT